jgi:hypothetical protein
MTETISHREGVLASYGASSVPTWVTARENTLTKAMCSKLLGFSLSSGDLFWEEEGTGIGLGSTSRHTLSGEQLQHRGAVGRVTKTPGAPSFAFFAKGGISKVTLTAGDFEARSPKQFGSDAIRTAGAGAGAAIAVAPIDLCDLSLRETNCG